MELMTKDSTISRNTPQIFEIPNNFIINITVYYTQIL